jgi:hypothetical protein
VDEPSGQSGGAGDWPRDVAALWEAWLRPWGLRAPLSGDVSQDIETSLIRSFGEQLGFININASQAGDPELERRIVEQVASYGRQLGRVLDALDVLIRHGAPRELSAQDQRKLEELRALREEVEAVKARAAAARIDRLVGAVRALRSDPDANRDALGRLRDALDGG